MKHAFSEHLHYLCEYVKFVNLLNCVMDKMKIISSGHSNLFFRAAIIIFFCNLCFLIFLNMWGRELIFASVLGIFSLFSLLWLNKILRDCTVQCPCWSLQLCWLVFSPCDLNNSAVSQIWFGLYSSYFLFPIPLVTCFVFVCKIFPTYSVIHNEWQILKRHIMCIKRNRFNFN